MPTFELPPAMASLRPELGALTAKIETHAPYGAVLLSSRRGMTITVENRQEQVVQHDPNSGAVLTAFDGVTMHEQAVGSHDHEDLDRATQTLLQDLSAQAGDPIDPGSARQHDFAMGGDGAYRPLSTQDKLERCRELHARLRGRDPRIVNVRVMYTEIDEASVFHNRAADLGQQIERRRVGVIVAAAGPNGTRYDALTRHSSLSWDGLGFSDEDLDRLVGNVIGLLSAERIEPGEYTIITAPGVSGTICHESFGHGVETDMFLKERAQASHFIDRVVASPLVEIWDDPSRPNQWGSYFFDDEGMLSAPTHIVEGGVFRRGITDLYSATALGLPRSANGRRQDYSRKAYARMSNTYFGAGQTPVGDLFQQVEHGVYLEKWSSGMEDPKGWGIQVTCRFGHEIRNGKVTGRMFSPIAISGHVPEVLQSISAVGDDWTLESGLCGKGSKEIVPVTSGGPHLLLKARLG